MDLDAVNEATEDVGPALESLTGDNPSSSSGSKKKNKSAHDRDPGYPPREYTAFLRVVALDFYRIRSEDMLLRTYLRSQQSGIMRLQADLEAEFWKKLRQSEQYMNCMSTYFQCSKWMAQQVTTATTNILHVFEVVNQKSKGAELNAEEKQFHSKLVTVQRECAKYSASKTKGMPWNEQLLKSAMERHLNSGVLWVPQKAIINAMSGYSHEGAYGKVRKVRIGNMDGIPIHIEFAGKLSKAKTEREKREERAIEALVCPVQHPGVIKFWAIHSDSMESYTLWWNGDNLRKFFSINSQASEAIDYESILRLKHVPMKTGERIVAFRKNRAMLAWALIYLMDLVHQAKIIHNDLTPSNILLHFPEDNVHAVYIGVCDWGMASRVSENKSSYFGYEHDTAFQENKRLRPFVAPELFYRFGPPDDEERNLDRMRTLHPYTMAAEAFAVGYLGRQIWNNEDSPELFKTEYTKVNFGLKLDALCNPDPRRRPTLAKLVEEFRSSKFNFPVPESCFRTIYRRD